MKKFFLAVATVAVVTVAGWNYRQSEQGMKLSDLGMANVEALASGEVEIPCDSYSVVIICQRTCPSCGRIWKAINGYGHPGNLRGTCVCGKTF